MITYITRTQNNHQKPRCTHIVLKQLHTHSHLSCTQTRRARKACPCHCEQIPWQFRASMLLRQLYYMLHRKSKVEDFWHAKTVSETNITHTRIRWTHHLVDFRTWQQNTSNIHTYFASRYWVPYTSVVIRVKDTRTHLSTKTGMSAEFVYISLMLLNWTETKVKTNIYENWLTYTCSKRQKHIPMQDQEEPFHTHECEPTDL